MNKTKKLLIDITFGLLYKKGYCATSITDILKIAKLTKGSIYYHFPTKNDLVLQTMEYYIDGILASHWLEPLQNTDFPIETLITQIDGLYDLYVDKNAPVEVKHGCPLNNFIQDMSDKDELFFVYLKSVYARWEEALENALIKAQTLKQTQTDFNPRSQALFIISALEGSISTAKAYNDINALEDSFEVLTDYIKAL